MNPVLTTTRLQLRPVTLADLDHVHELHLLPETDKYNTMGIPWDMAETKAIVEGWIGEYSVEPALAYVFVIEAVDSKKFIGMIGLRKGKPKYNLAEVWYKLHVKEWRNGYAAEALQVLLTFGFNELHLHRIEAGCAVENASSVRVMEKVGMQREGMRRKALPLKSGWADNYMYGILAEEFVARS